MVTDMGELSHLDELEAEAIYIIREVAAECEKPVMLYSIGKDSSVMLHLAMKAFYPENPPFPFLHVNTTWKFHEMIEFRDRIAKEKGIEMLEYINQDGVKQGINPFDHGSAYTDIMKTQALKQALDKYGFTAAFGGGRRDEEKSRAKERIFSFRNENHAWDPKNQRPEMWKLYNSRIKKDQSLLGPLASLTHVDACNPPTASAPDLGAGRTRRPRDFHLSHARLRPPRFPPSRSPTRSTHLGWGTRHIHSSA